MKNNKLNRLLCISILLGITLISYSCERAVNKKEVKKPAVKPNVLFIAVDDLNDWIGVMNGHPQSKTPNIDKLAREGVLFTNAHCQAPICGPSRASIMTGLMPTTTGNYLQLKDHEIKSANEAARKSIFMPDYFEQHGYKTMAVGKIYHNGDGAETFDEYGGVFEKFGPKPKNRFKYNPSWYDHKIGGTQTDWGAYPDVDNKMPDFKYAAWAVDQLNKKHDKPFFLAVGFVRPHVPWHVPQKWFDKFPLDQIELPPYSPSDFDDIPDFGQQVADAPMMPTTEELIEKNQWKEAVQAYLACINFVDAQVGKVLDALKKSEYAENTIIVLWSDHGYHLGEKNRFAKQALWERDTKTVLMFSTSGGLKNKQCNKPVQLLDLYPTLLELCDLPENTMNEGHSLTSLLENPASDNWNHYATTVYGKDNVAIADERYRLIQYADGSQEFYDLKEDPNEWVNLAGEAEYRHKISEFQAQIPKEQANYSNFTYYSFNKYFKEITKKPDVYLYNPSDLLYAKQLYKQKKEPFVELVNKLKSDADELLEVEPFSVMQKTMVPPSKNMHDYYSLGRYWWPNPDTEDGLPYVRHDGKTNPEYDNYDAVPKSKMSNAVFTLSLAYFYTSHEPYAKKANELIFTWFIDPETKMNPHLEYGQAIPGITEGRGIGIIETGSLLRIVNAVGFIKGSESFPTSNYKSLKKWFKKYNKWLVTSQKGWDERMWHNNHGSSYDSQVASFSLFAGEDSIATMILDSVIVKRINRQIEPDGSQPWELERTKSMSYSIKNLNHLMENAILAEHYGIDLWNYESEDGRSIKQAVRFLIPYMLGEKEWIYTQYGGIESKMENFKELIWVANQYLDDELIQRAFNLLCLSDDKPLEINLLYPVFSKKMEPK